MTHICCNFTVIQLNILNYLLEMNVNKLFIILVLSCFQISLSQVEFNQDNSILVVQNEVELKNAWAGGMNFCQFSLII